MNLSEVAREPLLTTEEKCIAYLESMRWPAGIHCPTCGNNSISRFKSKGRAGKTRHLYQCLDKSCRYQFSPTTGTIFHDSHLPLNKWFRAISLLSDTEKPLSINQLRLALGVQYKTAAHLAGRIRQAMENGSIEMATASKTSATGQPAAAASNPSSQPRLVGKISPTAQATVGEGRTPTALDRSRAETAELLNQLTRPSGSRSVSNTAIDNMLSMFVSVAQISVRPPLFFAKYIRDKVLSL